MNDLNITDLSVACRIKAIRQFRGLTQKELGIAVGFSPESASVRIRQLENHHKNARRANSDITTKIAHALHVSDYSLLPLTIDFDSMSYPVIILQTLFWLEELNDLISNTRVPAFRLLSVGLTENNIPGSCKMPDADPDISTAIIFDNNEINYALSELNKRKKELQEGQITYAQYVNWKLLWPYVLDLSNETMDLIVTDLSKTGYYDWKTFGLKPDQIVPNK